MFERYILGVNPFMRSGEMLKLEWSRVDFGSTLDDNNKVTGEENHQVLEFTDENWWARKDSNLRPMDYESTALTN